LNTTVSEVTDLLENLKLGLAAEKTYDQFWHWFCDEVIEKNKKGEISNNTLLNGLETFLKLLHPFVPFVTEAIWQELGHSDLLALASWPKSK
jgi:valyl-tRNA synthetase